MCIMCCKFWVNIFDSENFQTVSPMIIKIIKEIALHTGWEYLFFKKKKRKKEKERDKLATHDEQECNSHLTIIVNNFNICRN